MIKKFSAKASGVFGLLTVVDFSVGTSGIALADTHMLFEKETVDIFNLETDGEELTHIEEEFYAEYDDATADSQAEVEEIIDQSDIVVVTEKWQEELMWADDSGRSISAVDNSFHLTLSDGDRVEVSSAGDTATWYREDGIALVEFNTSVLFDDGDVFFVFDEEASLLKANVVDIVSVGVSGGPGSYAMSLPQGRCANKWVSNGFNILWDGLVCLPASWGTAGAASVPCYIAELL